MSAQHLTGWRLSAGDEHTVFDGRSERLVSVPCGGMSGRTFAEAADCTRLIAAAPELLEDVVALVAIVQHLQAHPNDALDEHHCDALDKARALLQEQGQ